jgi:FkbM family methyltransferase
MMFSAPWERLKSKIVATISTTLPSRSDHFDHETSSLILNHLESLENKITALEYKINLLEHFSHGGAATYVGNNRVLVKIVVANMRIAFFVEANDRLLSPWFIVAGGYETELTDYFVRELQSDSHCIDVGANFGYFTCLMARFCPQGRVIGIEADEHVYEIARDNVLINSFHNLASVVHAAASNSNAEVTLYRRKTRSGNTSIAQVGEDFLRALGEPASEKFTVKGVCVDELLPQMNNRVDFVKIDVEGAEPLVFEGARNTIAANPNLTIIVEWSPGQIQAAGFEVPAFLTGLNAMGLRSYELVAHGLVPISFNDLLNAPYRAGIALKRSV